MNLKQFIHCWINYHNFITYLEIKGNKSTLETKCTKCGYVKRRETKLSFKK